MRVRPSDRSPRDPNAALPERASGWRLIRPARCWALTSPDHGHPRCVSFLESSAAERALARPSASVGRHGARAPREDVFDQYLGFFPSSRFGILH